MSVSVVCTVLNEAAALPRLLDTLAAQTRRPDDVVICDGGSSDGTCELLRAETARGRMPLRVLEHPGANISQGRNVAIAAARGEWIAVTDAGVWLEPQWLAELVAPLERGAAAVAGFFVPDAYTPFERAMAATVLPELADVDPRRFLPSSRSVAFRKSLWAATGGYPEWLDFCEDLIFDFRVQALVGGFAFAPDARAHFRPRGTPGAFFRQYYRYARGDGKADLWRRRHAARYATYLLAVPLIAWLGAAYGAAWWLLAVPGAALYLRAPYRRLVAAGWLTVETALWTPVIRVWGDVAKMLGYPAGRWWRLRVRPPDWHVTAPDTAAPLLRNQ
jgi:glycosyltransferase involved in cell wall biosynthesis